MKQCPFCAEDIQEAAVYCKHCHRDLPKFVPLATNRPVQRAEPAPKATANNARTPSAPVPPAPTGILTLLGIIFGALVLIIAGTISYMALFDRNPPDRPGVTSGTSAAPTTASQAPVPVAANTTSSSQVGTGPGERRITRAAFGDQWPFTVDEGVLSCMVVGELGSVRAEAVYFRVGTTTYAVNGIALGRHEHPDVRAIWSTLPPSRPKNIVGRLSEARRRELFGLEVPCTEQSQRAADLAFPSASGIDEVKRMGRYEINWREQCIARVRAKDYLTEDELDLIDAEGYKMQWPPTKPVRAVNIGPIIVLGLSLCSR